MIAIIFLFIISNTLPSVVAENEIMVIIFAIPSPPGHQFTQRIITIYLCLFRTIFPHYQNNNNHNTLLCRRREENFAKMIFQALQLSSLAACLDFARGPINRHWQRSEHILESSTILFCSRSLCRVAPFVLRCK